MSETAIRIAVALPEASRQSELIIQTGILKNLGSHCREALPDASKVLVVTDAQVAALYLRQTVETLKSGGFEVATHIVSPGETSKALTQAEQIVADAAACYLSRHDAFLALGGGVVGDLTGFCAAVYHRGAPLIQVPTTLVAQVDSAIGGKTAVNLPGVKNAVGAFHQPQRVFIDPSVLSSLPERELKAGFGEIVKYSLIETSCTGEGGFFEWLSVHAEPLANLSPDHLAGLIERCCRIKAVVVTQDEFDRAGLRAYLNLGHTFAHAYETLGQYQNLLHGEAVAIGLLKAARLAERLGLFPATEITKIERMFGQFRLPQESATVYPPAQLLEAMRQDKKAHDGKIRFVLPYERIGQVILKSDVPEEDVLAVL